MPEITGLDLHRSLSRSGINIPTIVITAANNVGLRERCEGAGAAAFLKKPFHGSDLIRKINSAVYGVRPNEMHQLPEIKTMDNG